MEKAMQAQEIMKFNGINYRFRHEFGVYYEDTDSQNVVYHANYLHFLDRARTESISELLGMTLAKAHEEGRLFVVHEIWIKYRRPARLGDRIVVLSEPRLDSEFRLIFFQRVTASGGGRSLVDARVELVCINSAGELMELPQSMLRLL